MKGLPSLGCGLLLIASASAYTLVSKVTPVQKVLEMMGEMKSKGEKMMDDEAKLFRKYAEWADDQQTELGFEIKTGNSEIEKLTAFVESADLDVEKLGKQIGNMGKEIDRMETEMKDATTLRRKESDNFLATQQDLAESVDAIARARDTLASGAQDKEQAAALLQQMATTVPKMPEVLAAFLQEDELGAPSAAAYESQSDGVLAILDGLGKKFKKELDETETEESNKAHNYKLEMQHLTDTVNAMKIDLSEKEAAKGTRASESAKANGDLVQTKAELAEDKKALVEVTSTLETKTTMFNTNQKTRGAELEAIAKAIEIISSPAVSGLTQLKSKSTQVTSLLQTQSSTKRVDAKQKLSRFLDRKADLLSSASLKELAGQVDASPFAKVIDLIKGLISKLKSEAADEKEHKQFCDEELKANKLTREKEGTAAEKLNAAIEKLNGEIDTQGREIATLAEEQAALTSSMAKATDIRQQEKAKNEDTIKDAVAGADATKKALGVLKKFYDAQAFLQQAPDMEKFQGQQGGGVLGMLEVIESDFLRLKAETSADEKMAASEYDEFMTEAQKNKSEKHEKETKKRLDKDKSENERSLQNKDLDSTSTKLGAANKYYDNLKPTCIDADVNFSERSDRRKEEIKALKEAYGILDNKGDD